MAITLRLTKGSELTYAELDGNFTDLNTRVGTLETSSAGTVRVNKYYFEADSGDTVFSGNDYFGNAMTYDSNSALVYLNGMMLMQGVDYTLTSGNAVTTTVGIDSGHLITITSMELV